MSKLWVVLGYHDDDCPDCIDDTAYWLVKAFTDEDDAHTYATNCRARNEALVDERRALRFANNKEARDARIKHKASNKLLTFEEWQDLSKSVPTTWAAKEVEFKGVNELDPKGNFSICHNIDYCVMPVDLEEVCTGKPKRDTGIGGITTDREEE